MSGSLALAHNPVWRAYVPLLSCAVTYAFSVICARVAFEDGSNVLTVVTLRCGFALLAIGIALRISAPAEPGGRRCF